MIEDNIPAAAVVLVALAAVFAGVSLRDYLAGESKLTPARRTWLRMTFIFAGVAIGLVAWHVLLA